MTAKHTAMNWPANWPITRHIECRAQQLDQMVERLDVDPLRLARLQQGDTYAHARRVCIECHHAVDCVAWLARLPDEAERPGFCPNFPLLDALKAK